MTRSNLAVAVILLYSSAMLAQHSSGGSGGSSGSSSGGGGSHASSSGGSSSSSYSGGSHSSGGGASTGGVSGNSHSSAGSSSHSSGSSSGSVLHSSNVNTDSFLRSGSEASRPSGMPGFSNRAEPATIDKATGRQVQQMVKSGKSLEEIRQFVHTKTGVNPDTRPIRIETNEKRSLLSTLRHPLHKQQTTILADLRHRVCINQSCLVCPAGSSANGKGGCTGPVSNFCASGSYWSGNGCQTLGQTWRFNYCRYDGASDPSTLRLARQRMQKALAQRDATCAMDLAGPACSDMNVRYQRAVADYNLQGRWQRNSFTRCMEGSAFGFLDPMN